MFFTLFFISFYVKMSDEEITIESDIFMGMKKDTFYDTLNIYLLENNYKNGKN